MGRSISSHSIAPASVLRGDGAWDEALPQIKFLCSRPLVLGRSASTADQRQCLVSDLLAHGLQPLQAQLQFDCCEQDLQRVAAEAQGCDAVLAAGGGKVLDAGKLLAHRLSLPCITVPLSASTCAGWTALSNIYSPQGAFEGDVALDRCPDLLVFDHCLVRQAPPRTLASGVADALAKWYEASVSSGDSSDGLVQQAVQMARVLRDQLLIDSLTALKDPDSEAWVRTAEACALTAGVMGDWAVPVAALLRPMPFTTASPSWRPVTTFSMARRWASEFLCSFAWRNVWAATGLQARHTASCCRCCGSLVCPSALMIWVWRRPASVSCRRCVASPAARVPICIICLSL